MLHKIFNCICYLKRGNATARLPKLREATLKSEKAYYFWLEKMLKDSFCFPPSNDDPIALPLWESCQPGPQPTLNDRPRKQAASHSKLKKKFTKKVKTFIKLKSSDFFQATFLDINIRRVCFEYLRKSIFVLVSKPVFITVYSKHTLYTAFLVCGLGGSVRSSRVSTMP